MGGRAPIPAEKIAAIKAAVAAGGMTYKEIGKKFGAHHSTVSKIMCGIIGKGAAASLDAAPAATLVNPHVSHGKAGGKLSFAHLAEEIVKLTEEQYGPGEIAKKLNIPQSSVYYYRHRAKHQATQSTNEEGALTNGSITINKNIVIGIAYAEVERFISNISQRLGISADVLRPRLSELLGRSPLR